MLICAGHSRVWISQAIWHVGVTSPGAWLHSYILTFVLGCQSYIAHSYRLASANAKDLQLGFLAILPLPGNRSREDLVSTKIAKCLRIMATPSFPEETQRMAIGKGITKISTPLPGFDATEEPVPLVSRKGVVLIPQPSNDSRDPLVSMEPYHA
jgi:hypothetical protein